MRKIVSIFVAIMFLMSINFVAYSAEVQNVDVSIKKIDSAKGCGKSLDEAKSEAKADAIRQCIQVLVQTDEEKGKFEAQKNTILYTNASKYIQEPTLEVLDKVTASCGKKIEIKVVVNIGAIEEDLSGMGIIKTASQLTEAAGDIKILAFFDFTKAGQKPDKNTGWAIDRANWYMGAKKMSYILKEEAEKLATDDDVVRAVKLGSDYVRAIADKAQADIYLKIKASFDKTSGGYAQAKVKIEAYESGSGTLIASENGQSRELAAESGSDTSMKAAIEEAMGGVMDGLAQKMSKFWKDSIENGKNYSVVVITNTANQKESFETALKGIVSSCELKDRRTDTAEYLVKYKGRLRDLNKALKAKLPGLNRKSQQFNRIEFILK